MSTGMEEIWTDAATGWVDNETIFDTVFAPVTAAILDAAAIVPGQRVLDVGCGSGTLLAAVGAAGGRAVGVDISAAMARAARRRVPGAQVVVGDAQSVDLLARAPGVPFDLAVSRFGVMFFSDPVAAFANIRRASAPGARLVFACWRGRAENPMFSLGTTVLTDRLRAPAEPPRADAPGPTAFADLDRVAALLAGAGWDTVVANPLDVECDYATDGSDGVEERLAVVLSTTTGRAARQELEPSLGPRGWATLLEDVRAEMRRHLVNGRLRHRGAIWLVTATAGA